MRASAAAAIAAVLGLVLLSAAIPAAETLKVEPTSMYDFGYALGVRGSNPFLDGNWVAIAPRISSKRKSCNEVPAYICAAGTCCCAEDCYRFRPIRYSSNKPNGMQKNGDGLTVQINKNKSDQIKSLAGSQKLDDVEFLIETSFRWWYRCTLDTSVKSPNNHVFTCSGTFVDLIWFTKNGRGDTKGYKAIVADGTTDTKPVWVCSGLKCCQSNNACKGFELEKGKATTLRINKGSEATAAENLFGVPISGMSFLIQTASRDYYECKMPKKCTGYRCDLSYIFECA